MKTSTGQVIGNYVVLEKVGGGLSSTVFKGQSTTNPATIVAIKVIDRKELLKVSVHAEDYIQREIDIMRQLDHPNIVKLLEVLDDGNTISLVMEFCKGGSLREYLDKKGKLTEAEVFTLLSQLVDALKYMYSKSIIHRDLKPHNILLTGEGTLKICDYGFARIYEKQKAMNSILGSPLYMAPEILASLKYTTKCDLWSVGIILYEMLAGSVPFPTNSVVSLFTFYTKESSIRLPQTVQRAVSAACSALVEALLTVRPEDRITWPDFFQHAFFFSSVAPEIVPSSPVLSRSVMDNNALCVLAVPRCEKVELNISELDETCPVRLFKLSLATKLQMESSSISSSNKPPLLVVCTPNGVTEMEDSKPLSVYNSLFARNKEKARLFYIDITNKHDYAGEALCENSVPALEKADPIVDQGSTDVGTLVKDFKQFVTRQTYFHKVTEDKLAQCMRYLEERDILMSTVKKATTLLESQLKSLTVLSGSVIDLYNHQDNVLSKSLKKFAAHLQDMKAVTLHESLQVNGRVTLIDVAGGETSLLRTLNESKDEGERLSAFVKTIKTISSKADLEIQTVLSSEDTLLGLKGTQREVQQWVESLRLYRDHTAKWASVVAQHKADLDSEASSADVGDLEWSFVVDGLLEVRAGCAHDLSVAEKLMERVQAYWQKCVSTSALVWEELSSKLYSIIEVREALQREIQNLGALGQILLNQQSRIDVLDATMHLPKLYQAYLHASYTKFRFENQAVDLLGVYDKLREREVVKLNSFQNLLKDSPFEAAFKEGVDLSVSGLPILQPSGPLSYRNVPDTMTIDDEFSVVVPEEDALTFIRENAILAAEIQQLKEDKRAQDLKVPVIQMLGLTAETERLQKDLEDTKISMSQQANELSELNSKYNELVHTMKGRETEKSRERDEFSTKYAQTIEILRAQNKAQVTQYDAQVAALQGALAESKKETTLANAKLQEALAVPKSPSSSQTREAQQRERERVMEETANALSVALAERNEALESIQGALDDSESERVELKARLQILLNIQEEQTRLIASLQSQNNNNVQQ